MLALRFVVEPEKVARQRQVEGGTAVASKRSAISRAARAGSQAAQWTTPSRARQNVILSQPSQPFSSWPSPPSRYAAAYARTSLSRSPYDGDIAASVAGSSRWTTGLGRPVIGRKVTRLEIGSQILMAAPVRVT
jgi:hypothetical protein